MRLLGYREGRTRLAERDLALVKQGIDLAREAAAPAASVAYCAVTVDGDGVSTALPGIGWRSRSLARLLKGADGVSLVAATLGPGVEELTQRLFGREEYALATIVDAAGSALIHGLSEWVRKHLTASAGGTAHAAADDDRRLAEGMLPARVTPLYGPGYGDWPIEDQIRLVDLAGGPAIGLTCTETCYLVPQKSLVGVVGWLPPGEGRKWSTVGCARCSLADCAYRVRPAQR
jgi:hypothetical protein